jgi:hypothetical protein
MEDKGLLFRVSISLIFFLFLLFNGTLAGDAGDPRVKSDQKYEKFLPSKEEIEEVKKKFSSLNKPADVSDFEKFTKGDLSVVEKFGKLASLEKDWWLKLYANRQKRKKLVVFYLFSSSVPESSVRNILSQAGLVPTKVAFYPVLRGIPSLDYLEKMRNWKEIAGITVKINPLIFRGVGAKVVPAYVLAECDVVAGVLRSKTCTYLKVLYGDVSLKFALEKFFAED